eukprot:COSAG01_NODE_3135_length_6528_cov_7.013841_6_plen_256_part_00
MLPEIVLLIVAASSFPRSSVAAGTPSYPVQVAEYPPRGWNSYDSYTWKVSEKQFLANCAAVAKDLKPFGYEYCVVDYLWFQDLDGTGKLKDPITKLHVDANGRLQPALDRWPSTKDGVGFKPIADKVHALGMKFGIHVMRGISTAAVAAKLPILGTNATAADIGLEDQLCPWWKGVMAVDLTHPAGQSYYDSIYEQYADWGVVSSTERASVCYMCQPVALSLCPPAILSRTSSRTTVFLETNLCPSRSRPNRNQF